MTTVNLIKVAGHSGNPATGAQGSSEPRAERERERREQNAYTERRQSSANARHNMTGTLSGSDEGIIDGTKIN